MPPNCPRGKYPGTVIYLTALGESIRAQSSTTPLYTYYTMLMKTLFKALTNASLEKYIEDTYSVVKLESPLNV